MASRQSDKRRRRDQARQDRFRSRTMNEAQRKKMRRFISGAKKFKKSLVLTHEDKRDGVKNFDRNHVDYTVPKDIDPDQTAINKGAEVEEREMNSFLQLLSEGGSGYINHDKRPGWIRIMFENFNSIGVGTQDWKIDRINHLIKELSIDVLAGCETNIDWRQTPDDLLDLLSPVMAKRGLTAHNTTGDLLHKSQRGGVVVTALGRLCDAVSSSDGMGRDPTGLGRYTWIQIGNGSIRTFIVAAYIPHKPPRSAAGETNWEQQQCYFHAIGDFRNPDDILLSDLLEQFRLWRGEGHEVILSLDANQDVYDGYLAQKLSDGPYNMCCLLQQATGAKVPNSHFRGKRPITTIFGSTGLTVGDGMVYPHWYGVGDHRVFVVEVSASSMFGGVYPSIGSPKARTLNCKIERCRKQYNRVLKSLCDRHKMHEKLLRIKVLDDSVSAAEYQLLHNRWDNELGDFMASAEEECTKFQSSLIEYSPTVGLWLKRRTILKWILRWHDGQVPDDRNLKRAAARNGIEDPLTSSREDIEARLVACIGHLMELRKIAPELRRKHMRACLVKAIERGDEDAAKEIVRIRRKECESKRQRNINKYVKPGQGRMVMAVQVDENDQTVVYESHDDIVRVVNSRIGQRYKLGARSPLSMGKLAEDIGQFAENEAAERILDGTYDFPPGTDGVLIELLKEAARIRVEYDTSTIAPARVTVEDFTDYWHSAREKTSSSDSGRHFGHYIAASDDPELAILHTESLNISARHGTPLDRWKGALTVLLEKVMGNILIEKLRAICLLEADFNWWLKMTFARKMMGDIRRQGHIPIEQCATAGKSPTDGTLMKQIGFFDRANTLHVAAGMDSVDAAQCYDAVNHSATSLGMQAYGMSIEQVSLYLGTMAQMVYHLKTAFQRDEGGFSADTVSGAGPAVNYFNGLGQGSGGAPPAWQVVSSLQLGAYKRNGYGMWSRTAWSGLVFVIAAILFVDDCDLLHMSTHNDMSEYEFLARKQRALYFWARLLQVTGGDLKPAKCFWYMLSYKFVRGVAKLRTLGELPRYEMVVPQHDGTDAPIKLVDVKVAKKTLGVYTSPDSMPKPKSAKDRCTEQLKSMVEKGTTWQKRVAGSKLSCRDRWFSFFRQLKPSMIFGMESVMDPPEVVTGSFQALYFMTLPHLGVNRYITTEWRMLPIRYQGLGLPNMALEKLAMSIMWVQRHWGVKEGAGIILREAYERLQMETGLSGNTFLWDYSRYECLATHTWLKVLWQYLHTFGVRLDLPDVEVPSVRERDKVIMDEVTKVMNKSDWPAVNRVRKKLQLYFLSQLSHCDGVCVKKKLIGGKFAQPSMMDFPYEEPTASDRKLWKRALTLITSPNYRIQIPLGKFNREPFDRVIWLTDTGRQWLLQRDMKTNEEVLYAPCGNSTRTRQGSTYVRQPSADMPHMMGTHYATVHFVGDTTVSIHSVADIEKVCGNQSQTDLTVLDVIRQFPNQSLWENLDLDGDGNWILDSLKMGTLICVHDGSYMELMDRSTCSAAVVLFCTEKRRLGTASCAERTDTETATNYRGELLGGLLISLILKAACSLIDGSVCPAVLLACDNNGVVGHGNNRQRSLPEKQTQVDVIRCFRSILSSLTVPIKYEHVYGHQDDKMSWSALSLEQQLNTIADKIAKDCLLQSLRKSTFISSIFPFESLRVLVRGNKCTSSIKRALYKSWGRSEAITLLSRRKIVAEDCFDLIYWDGVEQAMEAYPQMFRVYITKHVSHFQGTHRQLSRDKSQDVENVCPCCGRRDESTGHITRCQDEGRTEMFHESVDLLIDFLYETEMDPRLIDCIIRYLEGRDELKMTKVARHNDCFRHLGRDIDTLGWDCFLEGRVPISLIELQNTYLQKNKSWWKIKTWSSHFIQHLLNITHRQWCYRNAKIHLRKVEGLTATEHEDVIELVKDMVLIDPADLLPQHRSLLEKDFGKLGEGATVERKLWLQQMRSAISAADTVITAESTGSRHSGMVGRAVAKYDSYRQLAAIEAVRRSNMAKKVRL